MCQPIDTELCGVRSLSHASIQSLGKDSFPNVGKMKRAQKFCKCIKAVKGTVKLRPGLKKTEDNKEKAAIAICVKTMLQRKGRTLKRFSCKKGAKLTTQRNQRHHR